MAISYPILMPVLATGGSIIKNYTLRMVEKIGVSESPFTFKQQLQDYGAMRWELEFTTVPLYGEDARNMRGFLQSLRGRLGSFYFYTPQTLTNQYELTSAGFIGDTEIEVGLSSGYPQHNFTRGTYFSIDNRLYMALDNKDSNGDVEITPRLRHNLNTGTNIITTNPIGIFRLNNNDPSFSVDVTEGHSISISCHEVI